MGYEIVLTRDAERDLEDIYRHIAEHDSPAKANHVLERLLDAAESLREFPDRGPCPPELRALGLSEYHQVFFKPYRVIYRVHAQQAVIYLVVDGRRDMQSLLARRLLGA